MGPKIQKEIKPKKHIYPKSANKTPTNNELFLAYLKEQKALGAKAGVIASARNKLKRFLNFLEEHGQRLGELTYEIASEYQRSLLEHRMKNGRPYRPNTVINLMSQASSLAAWLSQNSIILTNPFRRVRKIAQHKRLPRDLPDEDSLDAFLDHLSNFDSLQNLKNTLRRYRTHILAEFLYSSGLRIAEASGVRMEDVDLDAMRLIVREPKGSRIRTAFLGSYQVSLLKVYIERIRPLLIEADKRLDSSRLFLNSLNTIRRKFNEDLKQALRELSKKPGFKPIRIRSHDLRHSLGYHLLRAGCPLRYIQQILGHAHIGSSEVYTKVDGQGLSFMLDSYHPRGTIPRIGPDG